MLNFFCDFIPVFVFTTNHHLNRKKRSRSTIQSRSRFNIADEFQLYSNSCMHGPSFIPLSLLVSENIAKCENLPKFAVSEPKK